MARQTLARNKREIKAFWVVAAAANLLFLAAVILQINAYTHQNSLIKDYEKQIALISRDNDLLEVKLSQSDSMENFNQYEIALAGNYEKVSVDAIKFVRAASSEMARR